jgi:trimethylamine-N-oxide reductase (cytochrome c)
MFFAPIEDQFRKVVYPIPKEEGGTEIRMIWMDNPCRTTCWNDGFKTVEAFRNPKIETLIVQHLWLENDTVLADIILPVNTKLEEEDIMRLSAGGRSVHGAIIENQAIEPVGESLSDFQVVGEVAKKLGLYEEYAGPLSFREKMKIGYENMQLQQVISWEYFLDKE